MRLDTLIRGGTVIDGSGRPGFKGDVGIAGGRIEAMGSLEGAEADTIIDAKGKVVSPGFIDIHTHSDLTLLRDGRASSKLRQGVTTELVGHCGFSAFPLLPGTTQEEAEIGRGLLMGAGLRATWHDLAGYLDQLGKTPPAINVATMVGHGTVRAAAMGYDRRTPTDDELSQMRCLVAEAMEQGAFGLTTGLTLAPSSFADMDEIVALCEEVAGREGIYITHSRLWGGWEVKAIEEAVEVGERAGLPVQVAHQCIIDHRRWGMATELLRVFEEAQCWGVDVTFDVYPYTAAGTPLSEFLPEWALDGGTAKMVERLKDSSLRSRLCQEMEGGYLGGIPFQWDKFLIASAGEYGDPAWEGHTIAELSEKTGTPPDETLLTMLADSRDGVLCVIFNRLEEDVRAFLAHPLSSIGSDGLAITPDGPWGQTMVHPRFYGTFPRVLGHYSRDEKLFPLYVAVHKMTGLPAARLGLKERGLLKPGYYADLVVFDSERVEDRATFKEPHYFPIGIEHVLVNGQAVLIEGCETNARPGRPLRRGE